MRKAPLEVSLIGVLFLGVAYAAANDGKVSASWKLDSLERLEFVNAKPEVTSYRGRKAVRLLPLPGHLSANEDVLAVLTGTDFKDGTIEVDVVGKPVEGAAMRDTQVQPGDVITVAERIF